MQAVNELITYALKHQLIQPEDTHYAYNRLMQLLQLKPVGFSATEPNEKSIDALLKPILEHAHTISLIQTDSVIEKDLIESLIMDIFTPRPSDYQKTFESLLKSDPKKATEAFYKRSIASNYIKTSRISKNIAFEVPSVYGTIAITINLSKPEKDPKAIALALKEEKTNYPECLLCKENVGFYGSMNHPARSNHRMVRIMLNQEPFYLQYSPYVYYNEHAILLHEDHIPMDVSEKTFHRLLDFIDLFPHYFMGSNAGLPIVGGSILNHEHYQGGHADFPINHAEVIETLELDEVTYERLKWPLSVIRLRSKDKQKIILHAENIRCQWQRYENLSCEIMPFSNDEPHNAITPIARKKGEDYILDIALRNNRTNEENPDGIFHPHKRHHHIKKENIGLIEVMGLAILPGRLQKDLASVKAVLLEEQTTFDSIALYEEWIHRLKNETYNKASIDRFIEEKVADAFIAGLEDCGVFKQTPEGQNHFKAFIKDTMACLKK